MNYSFNKQQYYDLLARLEQVMADHLFDPNISHIDLGFRIRDTKNYKIENELAIRVHVKEKLRGKEFERFSLKYPSRVIDSERIGCAVDIPQVNYRLHYGTGFSYWFFRNRFNESGRSGFFDPMKGGISIANEELSGFGTLGGKVRHLVTGDEFILSNWHVLAGSWYVKYRSVLQPARGDGGFYSQVVAEYSNDAMADNIDAAIAKINGNRKLINEQLGIGKVTGVTSPKLGMVVVKSGRTSKVTKGIITGIHGQRIVRYDRYDRIVKHIIHIAPLESGGTVSSPGDSGSWWLEESTKKAVALHFAGSNLPEFGLAISMPQVLKALNVEIVI